VNPIRHGLSNTWPAPHSRLETTRNSSRRFESPGKLSNMEPRTIHEQPAGLGARLQPGLG
jgi:hypothetical protein